MNFKSLLLLILLCPASVCAARSYQGKRMFTSYRGLVMAGYQGWFNAPGDNAGRGWYHYKGRDGFRPGSASVDMWPDVSEYKTTYKSPFVYADGSAACLPSSYDSTTVDTHFRWMSQYGIDGVFMQRFVSEIRNESGRRHFNRVLASAMTSANRHGRAISVMYDLSGMNAGEDTVVISDIRRLAAEHSMMRHADNPSYLYHNGRPLVAVWGVGFNDSRKYGMAEAERIVTALKDMGFSVLLGVPTHWRLLGEDTVDDSRLHNLIRRCDIIMPWFVGRYTEETFDNYKPLIAADIEWSRNNGVDYAPLCYPGFSWRNLSYPQEGTLFIPRNHGSFFWKQLSYSVGAGAEMLYIAMFDEIDEGTAIFKCASKVPVSCPGSTFLPVENGIEPEHYMLLAGKAADMLRTKLAGNGAQSGKKIRKKAGNRT